VDIGDGDDDEGRGMRLKIVYILMNVDNVSMTTSGDSSFLVFEAI
jgi:hypothetical protein